MSALAGQVMVVSREMQGSVDHEPRQLAAEADPVAPRLLDRALHGDHEISGHSVVGAIGVRKGEDIGGSIDAAPLTIERPKLGVVTEAQTDLAGAETFQRQCAANHPAQRRSQSRESTRPRDRHRRYLSVT